MQSSIERPAAAGPFARSGLLPENLTRAEGGWPGRGRTVPPADRTEPPLVHVPFAGGRFPAYLRLLERSFGARPGRLRDILFARAPVLFLAVEESFLLYVFAGLLRALMGRRTVGLLLRPLPLAVSGNRRCRCTLAYMLVNLMMQNYLYGSFRWTWISELYEYVQSVHLLPAVISVMLNPTKPTFKVTAKDESIKVSRLSEISRPFFVIFAVLFVAFLMSIYRFYSEPYKADVTFVVGGWNLLNLLIAGCALGVVSERSERAASRRVTIKRRCSFVFGGRDYPATLENVSAHGARMQVFGLETEAPVGATAELRFVPYGAEHEEALPVDIRNHENLGNVVAIGCRFMPEVARHHALVADLIFANSNQWSDFQVSRRSNPGLVRGTLWFLGIALYQTSRGLLYLLRSMGGRKEEAAS